MTTTTSSSFPTTQFHGWLAHSAKAAEGNLTYSSFTPRPFTPTSIDIKITHCGICGSDIHTLRSGWGATHYPTCVGHEIIGHVVALGSSVTQFTLGERVGVGAQVDSCGAADCDECSRGIENLCPRSVSTYNTKIRPTEKGGEQHWTMGGYADYIRVPARFAFKIPATLKSEHAAPMLCGGITVYAPLKKYGAGPGVKVGVIGLGGLGHFAILFAKALGCETVVAISRRRNDKVNDAMAMGATHFIATSDDEKWARTNSRSLDLIISTVSAPDMPLESYLRLLRSNGRFIQVGAPEDKLPPIAAFSLIGKACTVAGSQIGSPAEIQDMLEFAAKKHVKPWVEVRRMKDVNKCVVDMEDGKARYRYVLENEEEGERARI